MLAFLELMKTLSSWAIGAAMLMLVACDPLGFIPVNESADKNITDKDQHAGECLQLASGTLTCSPPIESTPLPEENWNFMVADFPGCTLMRATEVNDASLAHDKLGVSFQEILDRLEGSWSGTNIMTDGLDQRV